MNSSTTYTALLARATAQLAADTDPDGLATRQALLLAAHAGLRRRSDTGVADWDLFTTAITHAVADLQADLPDPVVLASALPAPRRDGAELRRAVSQLVQLLADRYATAAAGPAGSPWRRLVWARVAHHLDTAAGELT